MVQPNCNEYATTLQAGKNLGLILSIVFMKMAVSYITKGLKKSEKNNQNGKRNPGLGG